MKRVGPNSLDSIHFLPSGVSTEETRQRKNEVVLRHIFILNDVKVKEIDERRGKEPTMDY